MPHGLMGQGQVETFSHTNGENHPHGVEASGHGCSGSRDTCVVVGDAPPKYSELGTGS
jgi:hypothetical protein